MAVSDPEQKNRRQAIRLSPAQHQAIEEIASERGDTWSHVARMVIRLGLVRYAELTANEREAA